MLRNRALTNIDYFEWKGKAFYPFFTFLLVMSKCYVYRFMSTNKTDTGQLSSMHIMLYQPFTPNSKYCFSSFFAYLPVFFLFLRKTTAFFIATFFKTAPLFMSPLTSIRQTSPSPSPRCHIRSSQHSMSQRTFLRNSLMRRFFF